jgi:2-amino-4-hydroxy-6-hydroxymethyldihydropteridine diphosphokinase
MGGETEARSLRHAGCVGIEMNSASRIQNSELQHFAIIALGSNLGNSIEILFQAFQRLQKFSAEPVVKSSLWKTSPVDCPPESPSFLNAVLCISPFPDETPESLLEKLQQLEKEFGRQPKKILNEPRPLDLDLIAFGNEIRATKNLTLPHPRAHERRFVLQPLAEIAPHLILPRQTKTVAELLRDLKTDEALTRVDEAQI